MPTVGPWSPSSLAAQPLKGTPMHQPKEKRSLVLFNFPSFWSWTYSIINSDHHSIRAISIEVAIVEGIVALPLCPLSSIYPHHHWCRSWYLYSKINKKKMERRIEGERGGGAYVDRRPYVEIQTIFTDVHRISSIVSINVNVSSHSYFLSFFYILSILSILSSEDTRFEDKKGESRWHSRC